MIAPASGRMSTFAETSRSLSTPSETVVVPVSVLLAVGASTQVPTPIFWSEVVLVPLLLAMTELMVLSAVLTPPRRKVLASAPEVMLPVRTRGPEPLAMSIGTEPARTPASTMGLLSVSPIPA